MPKRFYYAATSDFALRGDGSSSPKVSGKGEYRFNTCKSSGRSMKSTIRPWGKDWYWSCFMCLNAQHYPR